MAQLDISLFFEGLLQTFSTGTIMFYVASELERLSFESTKTKLFSSGFQIKFSKA